MAKTNVNPESEPKHNLKILVQTQSGPLGTRKHRWARVWYSPCKEGWTAANDCALIFIETHIKHRVKFGLSQLFLDFTAVWKRHIKQINDFSQTVTVEATKKHCAVTLRATTALQLCISCTLAIAKIHSRKVKDKLNIKTRLESNS